LMLRADLAFGAGGSTTWERCFLGLPSITIEVADHQRIMLEALSRQGSIWHLGNHARVSSEMVAKRLELALSHPDAVRAMSEKTADLLGALESSGRNPVAEAIVDFSG